MHSSLVQNGPSVYSSYVQNGPLVHLACVQGSVSQWVILVISCDLSILVQNNAVDLTFTPVVIKMTPFYAGKYRRVLFVNHYLFF